MTPPTHAVPVVPAVFAVLIAWTVLSPALAQEKKGYWWYETPPDAAYDIRTPEKPAIPPLETLRQMHPKDVGQLIEDQMSFALVDQSVEAVADYYRLLDFARRQARGFAGLHGQAILQYPELNPHSAYPTTNAARAVAARTREEDLLSRLAADRREFALVMFSLEGCGFCETQWQTLQLFRDRTGWEIARFDLAQHPDKAARFGVSTAPVTVMLRRGGVQWANVAVGAQSLPAVMEAIYRQARVLKGESAPGQFYTMEGEMGGFFDPEAGGRP